MLIAKIVENNTTYNMQEPHLFLCSFLLAIFTSSTVSAQFQLIYQLMLSYTYNVYNLNILQHRMIYHIHTRNYLDFKYIFYHIRLFQSTLYSHTDTDHYSNAVYYYKHVHLVYIYAYTFHAILCVLFN